LVIVSNLPAETTSFVGRRSELAEVKRLLEQHRLVTLTGPGGVGKTRLALRVAAQSQRAFPDGVHLVDLTRVQDHMLLGDTVLDALGVVDLSPRPATEVLSEYLVDRRALLLLDNCEHLVDACTWLVYALLRVAPDVRVLATSREPLQVIGSSVLAVSPTRGGDAVKLFEARARAVVPGFAITSANRATVAELCERLDGLPLAIELAAARLPELSLEGIRERLDDRFRLLADPRSPDTRHGSMQAALEWSVQSCSKPERLLWARLSVFAGDFDLDAAEEVCSGPHVPRADVVDLLAGLVDKSIIVVRRDGSVVRYTWLETLREYARRLLAERGEERELRRRHRDWYLSLARPLRVRASNPRQHGAVFARLLPERANLRAALEYSLTEPGEQRTALDLAETLLLFWMESGTSGEGRHWLERAIASDTTPSLERVRALSSCGWLTLQQGDHETAAPLLAEALDRAAEFGDEPALAWAVVVAGYAALFAGDLVRARSLLEDAVVRERALGDLMGVFAALSGVAQVTSYLGDPAAVQVIEAALAAADEHAFPAARSTALRNLGLEMIRQERPEQATEALREAMRLGRRIGRRHGLPNSLQMLGWAASASGEPERAARLLGAADTAYQRIGATMPVPHHELAVRHEVVVRRVLGGSRFAAAYRVGAAMSEVQAIAYALGEEPEPQAPQSPERSPLTRRERQVADLVARGLGDNEIGAELVIARRTAESHVSHILQKLDVANRAAIAAWVAQQAR
jgi:predicted ATPase/DNA-binding CsgD family transcriptional regulator